MDEILPGVFHFSARHPKIHTVVHSYFVRDDAALLDPMLPDEGLEWFEENGRPEQVLLTNRHHYRMSDDYVMRFGSKVRCERHGLHEFTKDEPVEGFDFGDRLAERITAHQVGAICEEETALHLDVDGGALAVADGVIRGRDGSLAFVPDFLIGDDPEGVKRGLRAAYGRLLDELEFDHLLMAHGEPWVGGAKEALREFVTAGPRD